MTILPNPILVSAGAPVDGKFLFDTLPTTAMLPLSLRYKGMLICVKGAAEQEPTYWYLKSDNLSDWSPFELGGPVSLAQIQSDFNQTDDTKPDYIKGREKIATKDELPTITMIGTSNY